MQGIFSSGWFHENVTGAKGSAFSKRYFLLLIALILLILSSSASFASAANGSSSSSGVKTLISQNPQGGFFGYAVASSGNLIAVGAYGKEVAPLNGSSGEGAVYLFNTNGKLLRNFTAPNQAEEFGLSVALSGTLLAIGAPASVFEGTGASGAAYLYNVTTGALLATFNSPNARTDGYFGTAVALSGNTLVIGAPEEPIGANFDAGNVYIFNLQNPRVAIPISDPNPDNVSTFGYSIAVSGNEFVVGAPASSVAYLFSVNGTLLKELKGQGDFGYSVGISGGLVVVGAFLGKVDGKLGAGQAYVFDSSNGKLVEKLASPTPTREGEFGCALGTNGQIIVVGALGDTIGGVTSAGAAYEFNATSGSLMKSFESPNAQEDGGFGTSVALNGRLILVGAPDETVNGTSNAGRAYVFL